MGGRCSAALAGVRDALSGSVFGRALMRRRARRTMKGMWRVSWKMWKRRRGQRWMW